MKTTDILGSDIWNAKAPEGVEITGKGRWGGLTLLFGPEVYWGANPKLMFKYDLTTGKIDWTFIHSEDIARLNEGANATEATERQSRQTTLYAKTNLTENVKLELGGIISATEKEDDVFDRYANGNVYLDQVEFKDTLGFKAKLTFPVFGAETYVAAHHAGLVADGGAHHRVFGVTDPSRLPYSGLGNKQEYEAGMMMFFGDFMLFPRVMYRDNLVHANPFVEPNSANGVLFPGLNPRDRDTDPFAVLGNREARSAELLLTYDPTGATPFYDWDNEWREDAKFAFNVGANYTSYPTPTDANLFFFEPGRTNASFGRGLPSEDVWTASSRMVFNATPNAKYILSLIGGRGQSTGDPDGGSRQYFEMHAKAVLNRRHIISGYFMKDAWGPFDFYRQFNITFPEQFKLDYSILLGGSGSLTSGVAEDRASKIGVRVLYRTNDENSPDDEFLEGLNDYTFQTVFYLTYRF